MRCALVLFATVFGRVFVAAFVAVFAPACGGAASPPSRTRPAQSVVSPAVAHAPPAAERALASSCRAAPSTIYGDEPVVFEIEGGASALPIDVELVDQRGHSFAKASAQVPGNWRPSAVPSGDFRLQVGSNGVSCSVTVNRELSRATQPAR